MAMIMRRTAVQGLLAAGVAPLINTGCSNLCYLAEWIYVMWEFTAGLGKDETLAIARRLRNDCLEEEKAEELREEQLREKVSTARKSATVVAIDGKVLLEPTAVIAAVIPSSNRVWALDNYGVNRIRILGNDPVRHIADMPIEGGPRAMAISPDRSTVYVLRTSSQGGSLLTIDTQTNAFSTPFTDFPTDAFPNAIGVSPDGSRLLVWADKFNGTSALYVIDVAARRTLRTIDLAGARILDMVFTPDSQLCFCLRTDSFGVARVWAFDVQAMEFTAQVQVNSSNPQLAISRTGDRLYVSHARMEPFDSTTRPIGLAAVDTSSLTITGYIPYTADLVSPPARQLTRLYTHLMEDVLLATFRDQAGYSIFNLAERSFTGPFVPDVPDSLGETRVLALAAFPAV